MEILYIEFSTISIIAISITFIPNIIKYIKTTFKIKTLMQLY